MNNAFQLLCGEKDAILVQAAKMLFDRNGRRIPPYHLEGNICDPDSSFKLNRLEQLDYLSIWEKIRNFFPQIQLISADKFAVRCVELLGQLRGNDLTANILNGVCLPICIPRMKIKDYSKVMEDIFLPAVKDSYESKFTDRQFFNLPVLQDTKLEISIAEESRHQLLIDRLARGPVAGLYFPNPLQGFSGIASREQIRFLPEGFCLTGGVDTATALVAYPNVLARDYQTPALDMAALKLAQDYSQLYFWAYDDKLELMDSGYLSLAGKNGSAGLLYIG